MEPICASLTCVICFHRKWEPYQDSSISHPITYSRGSTHEGVSRAHRECSRKKSPVGEGRNRVLFRERYRLLTVAIVQEVSDEAGTAWGPRLFRIHVSHNWSHDVASGAPLPIQINTWLGVIMEHVEDMACKRKDPVSISGFHPVS